MARKTANITLEGEGLRFIGRTGSDHAIVLDDGIGDAGMRPAELVPLALAGCTAMDVISILRKKRQTVRSYSVEAIGIQADDHPNAFTRLEVVHRVAGPGVEVEAVRRAIELSATRYCSVGATLASGATVVHHAYVVLDDSTGLSTSGGVLTLGPGSAIGDAVEPVLAASGARS